MYPAALGNLRALVVFSISLTIFTTSDSYEREAALLPPLQPASSTLDCHMMLSGSNADKHPCSYGVIISSLSMMLAEAFVCIFVDKNISKAGEMGHKIALYFIKSFY